MRSAEQIVALYTHRKGVYGPWHENANRVREVYNGEHQVVLPGLDIDGQPAVANLLHTGLDQIAQRIASTPPQIKCPPRDPSIKREVSQARVREQAMYGWWAKNQFKIMQRRRARHLIGYASSPVVIRPWPKLGIPRWDVRDPLSAFPSQQNNPDCMTPDDCIFAYKRSYGWVKREYPDAFLSIRRRAEVNPDSQVTVLEYHDEDSTVMILLSDYTTDSTPYGTGWGSSAAHDEGWIGQGRHVVLESASHRMGVCPVVMPGRVTLDRPMGQFDGIIGMYQLRAKLMALEVMAVQKGVMPDLVAESNDGQQVKLLSGEWQPGWTGKINLISGGKIRELGTAPGFQTNPAIDRIERAERLTAGVPAELGGESASNIRTGRRGDAVLSAAVDFPIQEAQELFAVSAEEELKRGVAVMRAHFGMRKQSFYVSWRGVDKHVDYLPSEVFTTDDVVASFPHAGVDLNGQVIMAGQLNAMKVLSAYSTARMIPMIEDAEFERDQLTKEGLEQALMSGWQQKIAAGEVSPVDAAWVMDQVANNKLELAQAIMKVDERVRERQATAGAPGTPAGPADPNSPEAQAGLAAGTPAAAQAMAGIAGPNVEQDNLASLLGRLRQPQMTMPSERGVA